MGAKRYTSRWTRAESCTEWTCTEPTGKPRPSRRPIAPAKVVIQSVRLRRCKSSQQTMGFSPINYLVVASTVFLLVAARNSPLSRPTDLLSDTSYPLSPAAPTISSPDNSFPKPIPSQEPMLSATSGRGFDEPCLEDVVASFEEVPTSGSRLAFWSGDVGEDWAVMPWPS